MRAFSYARSLSATRRFEFLHTLCYGVTLTFDLLTLNFYSTSGVVFLNSVQKAKSSNLQLSY